MVAARCAIAGAFGHILCAGAGLVHDEVDHCAQRFAIIRAVELRFAPSVFLALRARAVLGDAHGAGKRAFATERARREAFNIARVRRRVLEGGHDVPEREITRRWTRALDSLRRR